MGNFVAYYVCGLPTGIVLVFVKDLGALGMWAGLAVAIYVQCFVQILLLVCMDWNKEAQLAMKRGKGRRKTAGEGETGSVATPAANLIEYRPLQQQDDCVNNDETLETAMGQLSSTDSVALTDNGSVVKVKGYEEEEDIIDSDSDDDTMNTLVADSNQQISRRSISFVKKLRSRLKLIVCHSSLLCVAILFLVVSGISSHFIELPQYILNGNYSECSDSSLNNSTDNYFNITSL